MNKVKSKHWDAIYAQAFVHEFYNAGKYNMLSDGIVEAAIEEAEAVADWHDEVYAIHGLEAVAVEGEC